ncbi:hypothetical protein [Yoonia sp. I 8.24]|uniref:hypothetical protein n=1 Tax=Yoonia sp. I 8.24 TaxID=1537229 RepID=UPI001EDF67A8|nr:hypothetical protein [Yoonia sp. I 8.24]MCG3266108.1 hypothetical protein [Yoonia sp. I 8.24]
MATTKKKWVSFTGNSIIPAAMAGEDKDVKVRAGEPVQVPAFYADSVVQDRIAVFCDAPKKKAAPKKTDAKDTAQQLVDAQAAVDQAQVVLDAADGDEAVTAAQATLDAAQAALKALQA